MAEKGTGLPEISVLMPAYNAERYIEAAIRSLEEQTVENWELIVVDDCSTDGTAQLLRRLAAEDPRIRPIFSAENRGAAASRNLALEQCRGSYVALLDADDHPARFFLRSHASREALEQTLGKIDWLPEQAGVQGGITAETTRRALEASGAALDAVYPIFEV